MSSYGRICFYSEKKPDSFCEWIQEVVSGSATNSDTRYSICQSIGILNEWNDFRKLYDNGIALGYDSNPLNNWKFLDDSSSLDLKYIENFDFNKAVLDISFYPAGLLFKISDAIDKKIDKTISNNCRIQDIGIIAGEHDLFAASENENGIQGKLIGRSFFTLYFSGQGHPNDSDTMRHAVFQLEEIHVLMNWLESFIGSVKSYAYWD